MIEVKINKWGNSSGIRLPQEIMKQFQIEVGSVLEIEIEDDKLILTKANKPNSIHDLFKDNEGGSFNSDLDDFEAVGNELW